VVVRSRAPLRLSFAGGGTDVAPFPETEGGAVLSATIDRYAYGSLTPRADRRISVHSLDLGMSLDFDAGDAPSFDGRLDLVKAAVRRLGGDSTGFDLLLRSNAPPGSGLGSSSTMLVALVGLLREHHRLPLTDYEVAELAYQAERVDLRIRGGHQDHYAATFGGFNFIEFGERVIVNPLRVKDSVVDELQLNLLLCYTGTTRHSARIIEDQSARLAGGELETLEGLRAQKELAIAMKSALLRGELPEFGSLLGEAWKQKKRMSPLIATDFIEEAYDVATRAGALGGKVTGAGGGGYMLFFCPFQRKHHVAARLTQMGATVTEFEFASRGLTTWTITDD
jgi:D-glycero-alpha-D-manno-heptose-7-phosphate kinase